MFANNLKKLRESRGLTYRELADELNKKYDVKFSKSTIQRWEENESYPSIKHASALAHFFNVTLDELSNLEPNSNISIIKEESQNYTVETIAAHIDDDVTEEEMEEILAYIEMKKSLRKNRNK